jgi:hypothetical protein
MLNIWRIFAQEQKMEKKKESLAIDHYNSNLKQIIINNWKIVHYETKRKRIQLKKTQIKVQTEFLRSYFIEWQLNLHLNRKHERINQIAIKHYQQNQLFKVQNYIIY